MPNRILKESICTSDNLDTLDANTERFFYRLMVQCDDYGRMDARTAILRARCYPLKLNEVSEEDINHWLAALIAASLIFIYPGQDGRPYLQFITWEEHQQVRAKRSKYPQPQPRDFPQGNLISNDINGNQMQAYVPENPIQSNTTTAISNDIKSSRRPGDVEFGELATAYEKNIGMLTPVIADTLQADLETYGTAWCIDAINEAVLQNKRRWSYIQGILKNWSIEGRKESPKQRDRPHEPKQVEIVLSDGSTSEATV